MKTLGTCVWQMCNHRQDLWRYFTFAHDLCNAATERDLYATGQLADCCTPSLDPVTVPAAERITVPRRPLPYDVYVDGTRYRGEVNVHEVLCHAIDEGDLPVMPAEFGLVVPLLLRDGRITAEAFLRYMDRVYCDHFARSCRAVTWPASHRTTARPLRLG
ncbi:hypothetical protein [Streptomyces sp. NPDC007205]|uniref:hypothetical protein n=1 Tax=Streptomyces sp. NPDC007205 TaxID=3154316 RepID=UPI0034111332